MAENKLLYKLTDIYILLKWECNMIYLINIKIIIPKFFFI